MNYKNLILLICLTLFTLNTVIAAPPSGGIDNLVEPDPTDSSNWENFKNPTDFSKIFSNPNYDSEYLKDNIDKVPDPVMKDNDFKKNLAKKCPNCVKELKGDDLKEVLGDKPEEIPEEFTREMDEEQLSTPFGDKPENEKPLIHDQDLNRFNQTARDKALQKLAKTDKEIRTVTGDKPAKTIVEDDRITFPEIDELWYGDTKVIGGNNITISDDEIIVENAPLIDFFNTQSKGVKDFKADEETKIYSIDQASQIQMGCFQANDLKNARVAVNEIIAIESQEPYSVSTGPGKRIVVQGTDKNHKLAGKPEECEEKTIITQNANITAQYNDITETVEIGDRSTIYTAPKTGIECIHFKPISAYTINKEDFKNTFSTVISRKDHRVCIRKIESQYFILGPESTIIDLIEHNITTQGTIDLNKYFQRTLPNGKIFLISPTKQPIIQNILPATTNIHDYSQKKALKENLSFVRSMPEVIMFIKGEGMGSKTDVIISVHENLKEFENFIRTLKEKWGRNVEDVEVFLSSIDGIHKRYDVSGPVITQLKKDINNK